MKHLLPRLVLLGVTVGALGVLGVLAGRLLRDEAFAPEAAPSTELVRLGAGSVDAEIALTDGRTVPPSGDFEVADVLPIPDRMIPVIAPIGVAPLGVDEATLDAIQASFDDPAEPAADPESAPVPVSGSGSAPEVIGATPAFAPIPDEPLPLAPDELPTPTATTDLPPSTEPTGTAPTGSATESTATETSGTADRPTITPEWYAFSSDTSWLELVGPIVFDPCAGATPGSEPLPTCPLGYAATFGGAIATPPLPFMFINNGYYIGASVTEGRPCPSAPPVGDDVAELTMYTHTPLSTATFQYRRYGSSDAWVSVDVGGSEIADVEWWNDQASSGEFDPLAHMLKTCFAVPRDPDLGYEFEAEGVDIFGRTVRLNATLGLIPPDSTDQRPSTTAEIRGLAPMATLQGWSQLDGSVTFATRSVRADDDFSCEGTAPVDESSLRRGGERPRPYGFFDPTYVVGWQATVPMLPGRSLLVCATVFPDDNPFRVTATDRLVLTSPSQELPRIVVQAVRRLSDLTIPADMQIESGARVSHSTWDGCAQTDRFPELLPGRTTSIESTIWECTEVAVPTDASGRVDVPIRVMRDLDPTFERRWATTEIAIPIQISDCQLADGCRGREWYEIPIPMERPGLCGSSFGSGCEVPSDGIIVLRVEYPVVTGGADAAGTVSLLDAITPAPPGSVPQVTAADLTLLDGADPFHANATIAVTADRPVQVTFMLTEDLPGFAFEVPCHPADAPSATSEGFSERPTVTVEGLCAGRGYSIAYRVRTEDGATFDLAHRGWYFVPVVGAPIYAELATRGGPDLPALGYFYRIRVSVEGTNPTAYWWNSRSPLRGSAPGCMALQGTTFYPNGSPPRVFFHGPVLDVAVEIEITTTGEDNCSGRPSSGLGTISFTGQVTQAQLLSGEPIVVSGPDDLPLQLDLILSVRGEWRPA